MPNQHLPTKPCVACGRVITWRKKWERSWDSVRYCSNTCRARKPTPTDEALEAAIADLLDDRGPGKTICPSEAAKRVTQHAPAATGTEWRDLMEPARMAARRMVARGDAEILQAGRPVDPSTAKGPIRIGRPV